MDLSPYGVRASSGSLRASEGQAFSHTWTSEGIVATPVANGAQALHFAIALCVLNDTWREAARLGVPLDGVAVSADGGFDEEWHSTGITYAVQVSSAASAAELAALLEAVDAVAEIPRTLRVGATVTRA